MRKVLVFGTFDGIHKGHLYFLKRAKEHGDFLIGVVTRDLNVKRSKGYFPINSERLRVKNLRRHVDLAMLGEKNVRYDILRKIKPSVICIGYDQKPNIKDSRVLLKSLSLNGIELRRIRSYMPKVYKSSKLNKPRKTRL